MKELHRHVSKADIESRPHLWEFRSGYIRSMRPSKVEEILDKWLEHKSDDDTLGNDIFHDNFLGSICQGDRMVRLFLDRGANPDTFIVYEKGRNATTALGIAMWRTLDEDCGSKAIPTVRLLLERGANLNIVIGAPIHGLLCGQEFTPLHSAATRNQLELVHLLLQKGAAVNFTIKGRPQAKFTEIRGTTVFCTARLRQSNTTKIVRLLLKHGASVNDKFGEEQETALHMEPRGWECPRRYPFFWNTAPTPTFEMWKVKSLSIRFIP
jgi:hypothetical protein